MYPKRFSAMSSPLPQPDPTPSPAAFVLCPLVWFPVPVEGWLAVQQGLYQKALEEAKAVVRPSIVERDLLGVWN
jgi:hypothetical protein